MNKHTPGPWFQDENDSGVILAGPDGRHLHIADIWLSEPDAVPSQEEQEANAALIAAAPELLEALKEAAEALGYLDEFYDDERGGPVTPKAESPAQLADRLHAAIAKATGNA